ncbi:ATP-dependent zinc metalloprotease FtsH [Desulfolithobacter dissulfuricans]|uniref:ATP-dependent zinc metalloprotease FtsH n=1 Tax=Desulfolithobacter dissulfuricans TaxID=2795293 RepID=A0A915U388_9BACT|nr:ATP-dependent zinc metalloprotease FtsH [Desulfolithobacter dissulfuricans]BCO10559.1 ATP-dependent zinc metalloprotease FtsH [Desulfolithobacter dissulfuricans]
MKQTNFIGNGKKPDIEINKTTQEKFWQSPGFTFLLYLIFIMVSFQLYQGYQQVKQEEIPYSQFLEYVNNGQVAEAVVTDKVITGTLTLRDERTGKQRRFITVPLSWNPDLAESLEKKGVKFTVRQSNNYLANFFFNWVLPFGLLFFLWGAMAKRMGNMGRGFLNIGNKIHIHPDDAPKVTFDDVAGAEEAKQELKEIVNFLKDPSKIQKLGARMPKGVLMVGPPGTGKTLLARAVAGESDVPFFNISGSEFIEMFVGVGAARVRELFEQARKHAPCIIFIDEIDAIGRARGAGPVMGGHDEREQTLNQLLTEMDGFDSSTGVVVMAATNRPEILDKALLRAGRFDRQVLVDKPDLKDREAILKLYASKMQLADDVDLHVVAQRTPGFVGADLENICNEAAIQAIRQNHDKVTMRDFEAAIDRVIAGPEKKNRALNPEEKHRVAYHESGHALVAETVPTGEPVHKVSIIPRGVAALGYTLQLPVDEKFLSTEQELKDQIAILLGGRVAEELIFGDVSSGASNDLERASEIARSMITRLGMSKKLGPLTYGKHHQLQFLGGEDHEERNYSEETARIIDEECRELVEEGHARARNILTENRAALDALASTLEEKEVLDGEVVKEIIEKHSSDK